MKLKFASLLSLGLLSCMLFVMIFLTTVFVEMDGGLLLGISLTILINFLLWLISPTISDRIYKMFYKMNRISLEEVATRAPYAAAKIQEICEKYNIKTPKLGLIDDKNPSAFTYGSGKWNSRIIISEGIFTYLDEKEVGAVYAHELGHIKNNDFIVMTITSTLLQLMYQLYIFFRTSKNRENKKGGGRAVALIAYLFFKIGQFILLYLSRTREYYADKFSAEHTDANALASALIKIAMGILETPTNNSLIEGTQHMNIANIKLSKNLGLVYHTATTMNSKDLLNKAIVYDLKNPWAQLFEFLSTHPLNGKRIDALMQYTTNPSFNIDSILQSVSIDKNKMRKSFSLDLFMYFLLPITTVIVSLILFLSNYDILSLVITPFGISTLFGSFALGLLIQNIYKFGTRQIEKVDILECMGDIYASPIRGKFVELEGDIIGKGIPGLIFSEDMMLQDKTGLIFVDYQSAIPGLGDLFFALRKLKKLIGKHVTTSGWVFRSTGSMFIPNIITHDEGTTRSFQKLYSILIPVLILAVTIYIFVASQ